MFHLCQLCSSADLRHRLSSITEELESLRRQREKELVVSSDEKAVLQDMTNRLAAEIKQAKEEVRIAVERGMNSDRERAEQQLVRNQYVSLSNRTY